LDANQCNFSLAKVWWAVLFGFLLFAFLILLAFCLVVRVRRSGDGHTYGGFLGYQRIIDDSSSSDWSEEEPAVDDGIGSPHSPINYDKSLDD